MIILLDKPTGITSQTAVSKVKRLLQAKKVGHTGTLDPLASGLLPLLMGSSTSLSELLTNGDKRYTAGVLLGQSTTTLDITGEILESRPVSVTAEAFFTACKAFEGQISQIPPMYSAIQKNGVRLYELARKGLEVEREPRQITIYGIEVLSIEGSHALIDVRCSKGTYIRTLIEDIGKYLGVPACMESLRRTESAGFSIREACTLDSLATALEAGRESECLLEPETLFSTLEVVAFGAFQHKLLWDGQRVLQKKLGTALPPSAMARLYHEGGFCGLVQEFEQAEGSSLGVYWRK